MGCPTCSDGRCTRRMLVVCSGPLDSLFRSFAGFVNAPPRLSPRWHSHTSSSGGHRMGCGSLNEPPSAFSPADSGCPTGLVIAAGSFEAPLSGVTTVRGSRGQMARSLLDEVASLSCAQPHYAVNSALPWPPPHVPVSPCVICTCHAGETAV